jgi:hypothetical protein
VTAVVNAMRGELIKRIWEVDPLICPRYDAEMGKLVF